VHCVSSGHLLVALACQFAAASATIMAHLFTARFDQDQCIYIFRSVSSSAKA